MDFEKLEKLCEERGITIAQLERRMDFGNGTIRLWKTRQPLAINVKKVTDFFGIPMEALMKDSDDEC